MHWRLARAAAIWLLSASLVNSRDHLNWLSQPTKATSPTVAAEVPPSEGVIHFPMFGTRATIRVHTTAAHFRLLRQIFLTDEAPRLTTLPRMISLE